MFEAHFPVSGFHPRRRLLVLLTVLTLSLGLPVPADEEPAFDGQVVVEPETPYVFARVRFVDDSLVVRRDAGYEEPLKFNDPVYEGDRVQSRDRQRGELQLPDGSLLRLDSNTSVQIYDLFDPTRRDTDRTVLGLEWGRLQADVPHPDGGENFRVDTPAASIYPLERSSVRIDIEPGEVTRVTVERGRVEVAGQGGSVIVRSGERTRVVAGRSPRRPWDVIIGLRDGFGQWVSRRDDVYRLRAVPGDEYAALPEPVRPYYGELSRNGEWEWTAEYGWVWNPDVDDDWAPYRDGYWSAGPYGPVWVGAEAWGWPVYRYGRWDWRVGFGWCWIPGGVFRVAHVDWYYGPSYVGWVPLGYYDLPVTISIGFTWGHPYFDHHPWIFAHYGDVYFYGHDHGYYGRYYDYGYFGGHRRPGSARLTRPDLGRGVVSRRALQPRAALTRRGAGVRAEVVAPRVYDQARHLARRRASGVRLADRAVRESRAGQRRAFRERERRPADPGGVRARLPRSGAERARDAAVGRVRPGGDPPAAGATPRRRVTPRTPGAAGPDRQREAARQGGAAVERKARDKRRAVTGRGAAEGSPPAAPGRRSAPATARPLPPDSRRGASRRAAPAPTAPRRHGDPEASRRGTSRRNPSSPATRGPAGRSSGEESVRRFFDRIGGRRESAPGALPQAPRAPSSRDGVRTPRPAPAPRKKAPGTSRSSGASRRSAPAAGRSRAEGGSSGKSATRSRGGASRSSRGGHASGSRGSSGRSSGSRKGVRRR
ncbi:MAG: FecR domain-containing protein [Acidobacteriota bacterium]|nr:FecR domain-containing protein [Acidobacteriota bacterium]